MFKFLRGENISYRMVLSDTILGYGLIISSGILILPFIGSNLHHKMLDIFVARPLQFVLGILLMMFPLSLPAGLFINAVSFLVLEPVALPIKYLIHKVISPVSICASISREFCKCIPRTVGLKQFGFINSLLMAFHRALEDSGYLYYSAFAAGRMVGFYIFMRSSTLILLMHSAFLSAIGISYWWIFIVLSIVSLFVGALADYYAMVHIVRGIIGGALIKNGKIPECESLEKLIGLFSSMLNSSDK